MFGREMHKALEKAANEYPVVTLMGPRQSGKTTLVRAAFPEKPYKNLEDLNTRELALSDPKGFLNQLPEGAILDEIQRAPSLLSMIQVIVDEKNKKGMFILTGSHQGELHANIYQSLAGRTLLLNLLPMSLSEIEQAGFTQSLDQILYTGGFPRIYDDQLNPTQVYSNYVQTYVEMDLRQIIEIRDLRLFQKFLKLCAGRIGQLLNKESLANDVGVSARTINQWLSLLEASYVAFLLPPYFNNFKKRVTKTPKLYFYDVGLVSYLLGIESVEHISRDPLRGNLIENLIVLDLMKYRLNRGLEPKFSFYRDRNKWEVDLLFQRGHEFVALEIKSASTFNPSFLRGLKNLKTLLKDQCAEQYLIYAGEEEQSVSGIQILNYKHAVRALL